MPYPDSEIDRPPNGWNAHSALGLGLVAIGVVLVAALVLVGWLLMR